MLRVLGWVREDAWIGSPGGRVQAAVTDNAKANTRRGVHCGMELRKMKLN